LPSCFSARTLATSAGVGVFTSRPGSLPAGVTGVAGTGAAAGSGLLGGASPGAGVVLGAGGGSSARDVFVVSASRAVARIATSAARPRARRRRTNRPASASTVHAPSARLPDALQASELVTWASGGSHHWLSGEQPGW